MPATFLADEGDAQDAAQQGQLEQREHPLLVAGRERQVGDPADDREGGEQEAEDHAASVGVRQSRGNTVGPSEPPQHVGADLGDIVAFLAG